MAWSDPTLILRADANAALGAGHLMRCLTMAEALRDEGLRCVFATAEERAAGLAKERGFAAALLPPHKDTLANEREAMLALLAKEKAAAVLVDHYAATAEDLETLQAQCPVIWVDDLLAMAPRVAMILNYNLYAAPEEYARLYREAEALPKLLLGPSYTPLREAFRRPVPARESGAAPAVLISTGGADGAQIAPALTRALAEDPRFAGWEWHVLCGSFSETTQAVEEVAMTHPSVRLHRQEETDLPRLMEACAYAVAAGGVTLHELCNRGVLTVCFTTAANQERNAAAFVGEGLTKDAGAVRPDRSLAEERAFLERAADALEGFHILSAQEKRALREKMQHREDGLGAVRMAKAVRELLSEATG